MNQNLPNSRRYYAVLTGDLIHSSHLSVEQHAMAIERLKDGWTLLDEHFPEVMIPNSASVFRGDSWQLVLHRPAQALCFALFLRAHLIAQGSKPRFDTRVAIGIGTLQTFNRGDSSGIGEAYTLSGQKLDKISQTKGKPSLGLAFPASSEGRDFYECWPALVSLIDAAVARWTSGQALAVSGMIKGMPQVKIGALWMPPIKQSSVNGHLSRAGWIGICQALDLFKRTLSNEGFTEMTGI